MVIFTMILKVVLTVDVIMNLTWTYVAQQELLKLRKKITTTVQVLTHLKEKLQFVQAENGDQRTKLRSVEALAAQVLVTFCEHNFI